MAAKKAPARKAKTKAKPAKSRAVPRKKAVLRKKARKQAPSRLKQVENAILATVAEVDEFALDMGLLGATPPRKKRKAR
jgi:hypothetical protein